MDNSIELEDFDYNILVTLIGYMLHENQIVIHDLSRPRDVSNSCFAMEEDEARS